MQSSETKQENANKPAPTPAELTELWSKQLAGLLVSVKPLAPNYFLQEWSLFDDFFKKHTTTRYEQTLAYKVFLNMLRFVALASIRILEQYPTTAYSKFSQPAYDEIILDVIVTSQGFRVFAQQLEDCAEPSLGGAEQLEGFKLFVNQLELLRSIVKAAKDPEKIAEMIAGLDLFYIEVGKKLKLVHSFLEAVEKKENHIPKLIASHWRESQILGLGKSFQEKALEYACQQTALEARHEGAIYFFEVLYALCGFHLSVLEHAKTVQKRANPRMSEGEFASTMAQIKQQLVAGEFTQSLNLDLILRGFIEYYAAPAQGMDLDVLITAINVTYTQVETHLKSLKQFTMHWGLMEYIYAMARNMDVLPDHKLANNTYERLFGYDNNEIVKNVLSISKELLEQAGGKDIFPRMHELLNLDRSHRPTTSNTSASPEMIAVLNANLLADSESNARQVFERDKQAALNGVENVKKYFADMQQLYEELTNACYKVTHSFSKLQSGYTDIQQKIDNLSVPSEFQLGHSTLFDAVTQATAQVLKECKNFLPKICKEVKTQRKMTQDAIREKLRRDERTRLTEQKAAEKAQQEAEALAKQQAELLAKERAQEKAQKKKLAREKAKQAQEQSKLDAPFSDEFISPAPSPGATSEDGFTPLSLSIISTEREVSSFGLEPFSSPEASPTSLSSTAEINFELAAMTQDAPLETYSKSNDSETEPLQKASEAELATLQRMTQELIADKALSDLEAGSNAVTAQESSADELPKAPPTPEIPPLRPRDLPIGIFVPPNVPVSQYYTLFASPLLSVLNNSLKYRASGKKMYTQFTLDTAEPPQLPPAETDYSASMRNA